MFTISRCKHCGFVFTNPRPTLKEITPYYDSDAYISHSKTSAGLINRLFHLSRIYTLSYKKRIVSTYSTGRSILDYGCGTGDFLGAMQKSKWNCSGIEPNTTARTEAEQNYNFKIFEESALSDFSPGSFNAITLWHVMEHIYPLKERIRKFHEILDEKGTLFVAVPNMRSFDAKYYQKYWAALDVPRHIYHFTPDTIKQLMNTFGFEHVKTRPMILDAFYISMLSEKYKNGKPKNLNAVLNGFRSNISARMGQGNYSSLIYIFKKS